MGIAIGYWLYKIEKLIHICSMEVVSIDGKMKDNELRLFEFN